MPLSNQPEFTVVVPFYRASEHFTERLQELLGFIASTPIAIGLVLIDDGSEDPEITKILKSCAEESDGVQFIRHEVNTGKGRAVADGVAAAKGENIIFIDGDLPYELDAIVRAHQALVDDQRIHFVVGSRRHPESRRKVSYGMIRRLASWLYSRGTGIILGIKCTDVGCGIKGFRADSARLLFSNLLVTRFAFDVEIFVRAQRYQLLNKEIPVVFRQNDPGTLRVIPAALRMGKDILRVYAQYKRSNK